MMRAFGQYSIGDIAAEEPTHHARLCTHHKHVA